MSFLEVFLYRNVRLGSGNEESVGYCLLDPGISYLFLSILFCSIIFCLLYFAGNGSQMD